MFIKTVIHMTSSSYSCCKPYGVLYVVYRMHVSK